MLTIKLLLVQRCRSPTEIAGFSAAELASQHFCVVYVQ